MTAAAPSDIPAGFARPFRLGHMKIYIVDANGWMAVDFPDQLPFVNPGPPAGAKARGWGRIQYRLAPDGVTNIGHQEMDEWEQWLKDTIGDETDPDMVLALMNKVD